MATWQRIFFRAAGFGAGFAASLVVVAVGWLLYQSLPETPSLGNRNVIKATFADLLMNPDERPVATFRYTLENTTPHDYYLPSDGKSAFIVLSEGKGMSPDEQLVWEQGAYLPSGQKVTVSFRVTYDYNDSYPKGRWGQYRQAVQIHEPTFKKDRRIFCAQSREAISNERFPKAGRIWLASPRANRTNSRLSPPRVFLYLRCS